ncbi:hypothetical protein [Hoeflea poritis]|uniref:Transcriptional regulator n=1 Tax=Hoeflea poritis TaxID=2993659 RepID=A0ABT4VT57_9HYPH|nr:hypothetical protein [Hoeflea poritis]MDA4847885.1 hypothetical protein [Hoeflea poritis]
MVDFVAVIEKAVDGLSDNTPQMREKVYEKARGAIRRQLDNIDPPVSDAVRDKQLARLEEAILEIEDRHADAFPDIDEDAFADILSDGQIDEDDIGEEEPVAAPRPAHRTAARPAPALGPEMDDDDDEEDDDEYGGGFDDSIEPEPRRMGESPVADYLQPRRRSSMGVVLGGVLTLVVFVAAGIGIWMFGDSLSALFGGSSSNVQTTSVQTDSGNAGQDQSDGASGQDGQTQGGTAVDGPPKFTQRLMPDGSETDEGPAAGSSLASDAEGKSVAALDLSEPEPAPAGEPAPAASAEPQQQNTESLAEPLRVSQKMFLYEERLGQQAPTAEQGNVIWSIVRESPGDNLPPEPAIEAQITVPGKGLSAIMTIKRNADQSLPASHLIEIVFALTEEFDGNGIGAIQNFALKQTEQDTGDSLIAVPAKITDSFFMIALNDYVEAVQLNLKLLRERRWIDLPVSYGNGRRALLTLEKGTTGAEVFDQVIRAWEARTASSTQ